MVRDAFADFIDDRVAQGQRAFADFGRRLVRERAPHWLGRLDFADDRAFLEPMVFATACAEEASDALDPVLAGYAEDDRKPPSLRVASDDRGRIHLPRIGYVLFDRPRADARLRWDRASGRYHPDERGFRCRAEEPETVAEGRIEVLLAEPPALRRLFGNVLRETDMHVVGRRHRAELDAAFRALSRVQPRYYRTILATTRRIVVFRSAGANSFAALSCHGTAFLNASDENDAVFFVEDIAHQCGHVAFNAATFAGQPLLDVPPDTALKELTGNARERRTVHETLHGVFTEAAMVRCLDACHENRLFDGRRRDELIARIGFILRRFGSDAHSLCRGRVFTDLGEWVFGNLLAAFKAAYDKHGASMLELDFSNQPYTFSYARFVEANRGFLPREAS